MSKRKLSGKTPTTLLDVLGDPDMPNIPPEIRKKMWDATRPTTTSKKVGKIIVFGTAGEGF